MEPPPLRQILPCAWGSELCWGPSLNTGQSQGSAGMKHLPAELALLCPSQDIRQVLGEALGQPQSPVSGNGEPQTHIHWVQGQNRVVRDSPGFTATGQGQLPQTETRLIH